MRAQGLWLSAALLLSCSTPDPERIEDPYAGDPFPDSRTHFELPPGDLGVVSNNGSDTLTLLDLKGRAVIGSAPVGVDPVELDGPHHVAIDRPAGMVFTALSYPPATFVPGPHAAHGSSQRRGLVRKLSLDELAPIAQAEVDVNPGDVVLSADGSLIFVSHFDLRRAMIETELDAQRADVTILDAETLEQARAVRTCIAPHGIALSGPAGELAFVACYGEDAVAVIDTTEQDPAPELVSVGPGGVPGSPVYGPYAAILSPGGDRIAVSNTVSRDVRFLDVAARAFGEVIAAMPGEPYFPAWSADGARLFVPTQGVDALVIVDQSGMLLETRNFEPSECVRPHAAVFASDADVLFVVCEGDHESPSQVLVLSADTLEIESSIEVGVYPDALAVAGAP